ncbi:MAG: lysophospholipid acyltransferase family protein [Aquabacterium sp.]|uniref:lysophospholipid acyltransferase family protein n=1 Tax=Aquabacterium sp. TaxID=1872578 RepID=UPI002723DBB1|nr:lysophospholipid acyltransferase family protein [Aquabacterium sp.]MDO9005279.1 lysophospholipid acyltransferase family protein [Aquabacterium sp.]
MSRLFFLLARWPLGVLHPLGAALGWITYALSPSYRRRLKAHTDQVGLSTSQRWSAVAHAGRMVAELPRLWARPAGVMLGDRVRWTHPEVVDQALAKGKGVVLLSPHLGCFEICAQAYAERFGAQQPITALYRPAKQAWLAGILEHARNREHLHTAPATLSGVRQLLRALKSGQTLGMLPDQVPPEGMGVWAPFFGTPAYTMTMVTKLAYQTGASLVWLRGERLGFWQRRKVGADFIVHAQAAGAALAEAVRQGDPAQSAAALNRDMEAVILQCPQQYLWGYNRYKQPKADMLTSTASPTKDAA